MCLDPRRFIVARRQRLATTRRPLPRAPSRQQCERRQRSSSAPPLRDGRPAVKWLVARRGRLLRPSRWRSAPGRLEADLGAARPWLAPLAPLGPPWLRRQSQGRDLPGCSSRPALAPRHPRPASAPAPLPPPWRHPSPRKAHLQPGRGPPSGPRHDATRRKRAPSPTLRRGHPGTKAGTVEAVPANQMPCFIGFQRKAGTPGTIPPPLRMGAK